MLVTQISSTIDLFTFRKLAHWRKISNMQYWRSKNDQEL